MWVLKVYVVVQHVTVVVVVVFVVMFVPTRRPYIYYIYYKALRGINELLYQTSLLRPQSVSVWLNAFCLGDFL